MYNYRAFAKKTQHTTSKTMVLEPNKDFSDNEINSLEEGSTSHRQKLFSHDDRAVSFKDHDGSKNEEGGVILVNWNGPNDLSHPHKWKLSVRIFHTFLACWVVLASTFTSSITSGIAQSLKAYYHISDEVTALTISIFVAGYILGPCLWGTLSERVGRRKVFIVSLFLYTCWNIGCALAPNAGSLLALRFLAGTAAAAPLSNSGGLIADLWEVRVRGIATGLYACAPLSGPALSPIVSGFIQNTGTNFRWAFWICAIYSGISWVVVTLMLRETYAPALLAQKAKELRKQTGNPNYIAPLEQSSLTVTSFCRTVLLKPLKMSIEEPMLLSSISYLAFLYGVLYLLFEALPIVFGEMYGLSPGIVGLTFLPFAIGAIAGMVFYITTLFPLYSHKLDEARKKGIAIHPEERLPLAMLGAPALPIGFFVFAWTSDIRISFWVPMVFTSFLGFGIFFVFQGLFNFIIDVYTVHAASALAAGVILRSVFGAAFPLFARQMYERLGIQWGSSLLGFLALALTPIPYVLYLAGPRLRNKAQSTK